MLVTMVLRRSAWRWRPTTDHRYPAAIPAMGVWSLDVRLPFLDPALALASHTTSTPSTTALWPLLHSLKASIVLVERIAVVPASSGKSDVENEFWSKRIRKQTFIVAFWDFYSHKLNFCNSTRSSSF